MGEEIAMNELLAGVITGIFFGFIMQKAQVIRYDRQLGALRLQDMTIVKFMLTTILIAMVGIYSYNEQEYDLQFDYSDDRDVAGVKMPFTITRTDWSAVDTLTIVDVKPNVPIDDAKFARPKR